MERLECPRCQSENIETDDVFDISSTPFVTVNWCHAHCIDCGANMTYDRIYKFVGYKDIEFAED